MKDYLEVLNNKFGKLKINLICHDTSHLGYPAFIQVQLDSIHKDKGLLILDLGNFIYRKFGLSYQHPPEFNSIGKIKTVRFYMSWKDVAPIQEKICSWYGKKVLAKDHLPFEFQSIPIQGYIFEEVAIWKKTGEIVIYRQKTSGSEIEFEVNKKRFIYMQADLGPITDFEILGEL